MISVSLGKSRILERCWDLFTETRTSAPADNILLLSIQFDGRRAQRTLRTVKARGIARDLDKHDLAITSRGIEVG